MSNDIYDGTHVVIVDVVNERQILLIPTLNGMCRSDATIMCDFPIGADTLGKLVLDLFARMDLKNLEFREKFKNYWLMPKGITSWKKFEKATLSVQIHLEEGKLNIYRYYLIPGGGFTSEADMPNLVLNYKTSAEELGSAVLEQIDLVRERAAQANMI